MSLLRIKELEAQLGRRDARIAELEARFTCRSEFAIRPILYTDTVNSVQTCRDDLWAISTSELNELSNRAATE